MAIGWPCPHDSMACRPTGIDAGAGESLLCATTSVGDSFASSSSDSDVAKGARASKLRVLVPRNPRILEGFGCFFLVIQFNDSIIFSESSCSPVAMAKELL